MLDNINVNTCLILRFESVFTQRTTLRDVAKAAQVSTNTVSLALRNSPRLSQATRDKVLAKVQEVGYVPNGAARTLITRRSNTIGLVAEESHPHLAGIITSVIYTARALGYDTVVALTREEPASLVHALQQRFVDGAVLSVGSGMMLAYAQALATASLPHIFICNHPPAHVHSPAIIFDDQAGAAMAVRHLIDSGHRRIAYLAGPRESGAEKLAGVHEALAAAGLALNPAWMVCSELSVSGGYAAAQYLMETFQADLPTAVFARTDMIAIGALHAFSAAGVAVPEKISMVGYDAIEAGQLQAVPLTSVVYPSKAAGFHAVHALQQAMTVQSKETSLESIVLEPRLVIGGTTRSLL